MYSVTVGYFISTTWKEMGNKMEGTLFEPAFNDAHKFYQQSLLYTCITIVLECSVDSNTCANHLLNIN